MPNQQPNQQFNYPRPQFNLKYILIILILAILVGGGILGYQYWWLPKQEVPLPEITIKNETADWQTYRNEEYGFEVKYPKDWEIQDYKIQTNLAASFDILGFIPISFEDFPACKRTAEFLKSNYAQYNPFPGYESYAQSLAKAEDCSIRVRIEENPNLLSIKDYLKENYASKYSQDESFLEKINSLEIDKSNGVEKSRSSYGFWIGLSGSQGEYISTDILNKEQSIIKRNNYIVFITNYIIPEEHKENIFNQTLSTFKFIK